MIIKKYDYDTALSKVIHSSIENEKYNIKGPYGVGMDLNEETSGTIYLFAGGTGILPFMDFLFYML